MAHYQPLKTTFDNKWRYTVTDSSGTRTHICCLNCSGHENSEEAYQHYLMYSIQNAKKHIDQDNQKKCEICQTWTQNFFSLDFNFHYLCDEHLNAESLQSLYFENKKPQEDKVSLDFSNVPVNLENAMILLDSILDDETKQLFLNYKTEIDEEHFCCYIIASMGLRNAWGFWHDSPVAHWFRQRGIWMADGMSAIISTAFYHHLKQDKQTDEEWIKKERDFYDNYWNSQNVKAPTYEEWLLTLN